MALALTPLAQLACGIFIATYALIISERINRAVAALLGAGIVVLAGVLTQEQAIGGVDFNTIGLLAGMMMIVGVAKKSGLFGYVAIRAAQAVKASPAGILAALVVVTAVFSALLDNVTTVLLIVPVTFVIAAELDVPAYPFLVGEVLASNIGGAATLIGDPPNILIGTAAHLSFDQFLINLGPVILVVLIVQMLLNHVFWGIRLHATPQARAHMMSLKATEMILDRWLLGCSIIVIVAVIAAFVMARTLHLEAASIALSGAALMLLLETIPHHPHRHAEIVTRAFSEIEGITLFFFVGLFIVVGAVERTGVLAQLANVVLRLTGGEPRLTASAILWGSAVFSAIVDNIPFVATMIPLIQSMKGTLGADALIPLWWALSLGACLGGNGTLIGASANLMVAGLAEKNGVRFSFLKFTAAALPMMLLSVAIAQAYIWWRYFP